VRVPTTLSAVLAILLVTAALGSAGTEEAGVAGSDFHKNDITYSTEVVTPHVKWATKLPGGPIKGFFIPSVEYGRDMVELMQRLDLDPTTVSIDRDWDVNCWGIGDYYSHRYRGDRDDFQIVYGYVEKDLTGPEKFDVMVIPGINGWSRMTRSTRDAILRRVEEGAGLVLIHPFVGDVKQRPFAGDEPEGDRRIWDISPLVDCPDDLLDEKGYPEPNEDAITHGTWEIVRPHFITNGLAVGLLPEGSVGGRCYKYRANGDVLVRSGDHPIIAVKSYGRGRVVALAYVNEGFIPEPTDPVANRIHWDYWEYQYSLLARCVLWAAGRESDVALASLAADGSGASALEIALSASTPRAVDIQIDGKNEFGQALGSHRSKHALASGDTVIEVPAAALEPEFGWPGGRQIFSVIIRDADSGATLDWGAATFTTPKRAAITRVAAGSQVYKSGDTLTAVLHSEGQLDDLSVRFKVTDDLDRLLTSQVTSAKPEASFYYPFDDFVAQYAYVTAELVDADGAIVDQLRAEPIAVVQAERRDKEYAPQVSFGGGRHYFRDLRRRLVRAAGADTGFTWGAHINNGLDVPSGTFGVYWYHRGPTTEEALERAIAEYQETGNFDALKYNTKRALYGRTGDKKFLTRIPCFHDREFMRTLGDIVRQAAAGKRIYNFDYYFVGDEGSLTSYGDALDFCWGPHTLAAFREWLKREYGSLAALNAEWKTDYPDWDSVVPYITDEARETGNFAPWADHRTFMEITFADAYTTVRDAVLAGDPDGHIAVSGTQATNAYNGCDWYRLDQVIDDFLSYGGGNQWDLHRSFAKPGAMIGFWTGYGSRGMRVQNAIWTAALHNVLHPNIFWMYSYLDPDFTYSRSAHDMGEAFKALRFEGIGRLLMESQRLHDGIAIHYSMPSVHAATITGNEARRRRREQPTGRSFSGDRSGWVSIIKDLGMQFNFVSYDQLEKGALAGDEYRVIILPMSMALSPEEVEAIRRFVSGGGVVIADAAAGLMNDHCSWVENGMLNDLFGISTAPSDKREFLAVTGPVTVTTEGSAWGLSAQDLDGMEAAERVQAEGGKALVKVGDTDAVVVHRLGRGWFLYLNALLDGYSRLRWRDFGGACYRNLLNALLDHIGVRPRIRVLEADGSPLANAIVARYQLGSSLVLGIVKETVGVEGRDGVTYYDDSELGRIARQQITIRLPRRHYAADARTGERFGYTDTVNTAITVGGALVLGLSNNDGKIRVTGPASAELGEHPVFSITSSEPGKTLVRCHFFAPDGSLLPAYAKNVLMEGTGSVVLPSALNDPAGDYTLRVTDVLSGATASASISLH
jgi:hypothetical protein